MLIYKQCTTTCDVNIHMLFFVVVNTVFYVHSIISCVVTVYNGICSNVLNTTFSDQPIDQN